MFTAVLCIHFSHGQILAILADNVAIEGESIVQLIPNDISHADRRNPLVHFFNVREMCLYCFNEFIASNKVPFFNTIQDELRNPFQFRIAEMNTILIEILACCVPDEIIVGAKGKLDFLFWNVRELSSKSLHFNRPGGFFKILSDVIFRIHLHGVVLCKVTALKNIISFVDI